MERPENLLIFSLLRWRSMGRSYCEAVSGILTHPLLLRMDVEWMVGGDENMLYSINCVKVAFLLNL